MTKVYARLDTQGCIQAVESDIFLPDPTGWVQINEGSGDRYAHAQSQFFPDGIHDAFGIPLYCWDGEKVVARTAQAIAADRAALPAPPVTETGLLRAQIQAISERNDFLEDCVAEMATIIYA